MSEVKAKRAKSSSNATGRIGRRWSCGHELGGELMPRYRAYNISYDEAHRLLSYDPLTGVFAWKVQRGLKRCSGDVAGSRLRDGRIMIEINGSGYQAARLAWLLLTGRYPAAFVDHKDNDPSNNRFANLREATPTENSHNVKLTKRNTSGLKGASWYAPSGRWAAKIRVNKRLLHLGYHATAAEAHDAYVAAANIYFGEFARAA